MGKTNRKLHSEIAPLSIIRGRQEPASYKEQLVPEYAGNPLIEALPQIMARDEVIENLAYFPTYSEEQRNEPAHIRAQLIENAREFFIPQGIHLEIETKISCMLRRGLMARNPMAWGYWKDFNTRIASLHQNPAAIRYPRAKARGFAIVGMGGIGKSTTVENILALYPQVIVHTQYQDKVFILKQLVWLKLDCPRDGSTRSLCENFFLTVDDILGTDYYNKYVGSGYRHNTNVLLIHMARVASIHCLGLLVIDEIQDLSAAKSGGAKVMLNFFVSLENTIGVPYNLIGASEARHLFTNDFRHARRASEQGDVNWKPMNEKIKKSPEEYGKELEQANGKKVDEYKVDPVWAEFVKALWMYQYVKKLTKYGDDLLKDNRVHALYDESQGVTAVASALFLLAQRRAIASGTETITAGLIRSVARDSQDFIADTIGEHKKGVRYDTSAISDDSDLPYDSSQGLNSTSGKAPAPAKEIRREEISHVNSGEKVAGSDLHSGKRDGKRKPRNAQTEPASATSTHMKVRTGRKKGRSTQGKSTSAESSVPQSNYIKPATEFLNGKSGE